MFRRKFKVIRQSEATECGLACIAMIAGYYGYHTDLITLRRKFNISARGSRLSEILHIGDRLGLTSSAFKLDVANLAKLQIPALLFWNKRHFVVLKSINRSGATVLDPALGQRRYKTTELAKLFSGVAVEMTPTPDFVTKTVVTPMSLSKVLGKERDFIGPILRGVGLSVIIQLLLLASPLLLQVAVDRDGRYRGISPELIALGFVLVAIIRAVSVAARSLVTRQASIQIGTQITVRLFRKMIQLPMGWFQRRHVGDVVARFQSTKPVRELLADKMITGVSDVIGVIFSAAMLLTYSLRLAGIVFGGVFMMVALRAVFHSRLKQQEELAIAASARENSMFLETARAIQTIKATTSEPVRVRLWQDKQAERLREEGRVRELSALITNLSDLMKAMVFILVVYVGVAMVRHHRLTLGMFYAVVTYRQLLEDRVKTLLDLSLEWLSVKLHIDRVGEIALARIEPCDLDSDAEESPWALEGALELRNVGFRHAPTEPPVLQAVNLNIEAGAFVAITGESGSGKTTLLKIMAGLLTASAGEILVDGKRLLAQDLVPYRRQVGVVLQDDTLLAGSVLENICMFESDPDIASVEACCRLAAIYDDIMALPMRYETLAGDMGSTFSGGQKQRLFLARALYRRPKILFLDEGTSALDLATEHTINVALKSLRMTRVVIAHRPETIKAADRIIKLERTDVSEGVGAFEVLCQKAPTESIRATR